MDLFAIIKRFTNVEFIRFLIAGGINTVFGYTVFAVSFFLIQNEAIALLINYILGAIFNYQSYSRLAFSGYQTRRFIMFCIMYVVVYFVNYLILFILTRHYALNAYLSQLVSLIVCPLLLFVLLRKFVFLTKQQS